MGKSPRPEADSNQAHWDAMYGSRAPEKLGWYEPRPATLELVLRYSQPTDGIVDVGGGDSGLAGELFRVGYHDITVVDLSVVALERSRARVPSAGSAITWIHADVTSWRPGRVWHLWHDRAVFHFLTAEADRSAYKATARAAVAEDGRLIVAAFGPDGPEQCAGLPVVRYGAEQLAAAFAPEFRPVQLTSLHPHDSSIGDQRPYVAAVLAPVT